MASSDLTYQPDYDRIRRGLKDFHATTEYPLELKIAGGRMVRFDSYAEYHLFISKLCNHYSKTGQKHLLAY